MSTHALKRTTKTRWTIASVIALAILLGSAGYYYYSTLQTNTANQSVVETSIIGRGDIILTATGIGTLIPSEEVSFGFRNSGQVSEVLVSLGEQVEADQTLARLESKILELEYKQAEANLAALASASEIAAAEQAVEDAKESFATARDDLGYMIGPGMLIAEEKVADAQEELETAKAAAEKDASEENQRKISEAESAPLKAQEAFNYAYHTYSSNYTLNTFTYPIRNNHGVTIRRQLLAPTDTEIAVARAAYQLAKINLEDAQDYLDVLRGSKKVDEAPASSITAITEARIVYQQAKANLDATELIAPISGTVTSLNLNVGDDVGTSAVVTISDLSQPYTLDVYLDETDWDKAKVGYAATVTFDLLPNDNCPGEIVEVYPALDDSSGTSMVHIRVQLNSNVSVDIPSGSSASVDVTGGEALGAILVPTSALKEAEPGKYVVYLMQNGAPVEQEIEIGLQDILYTEVKSGLQPGDVVLTDATAVAQ